MKIAQFRKHLNEGCSYDLILNTQVVEGKYSIYRIEDGYIRLSEWVEVTFPPRDPQEHVPEQLASLDAAERELRLKFEQKLHEIADARARVRALTHQPDSQEAAPGASTVQGAAGSSGMASAAEDSPPSAVGGPSSLYEDDKYSHLQDEARAERRLYAESDESFYGVGRQFR